MSQGSFDLDDSEVMLTMEMTSVVVIMVIVMGLAYLLFVIFFTRRKFLKNKIYTEKRQFFALNL